MGHLHSFLFLYASLDTLRFRSHQRFSLRFPLIFRNYSFNNCDGCFGPLYCLKRRITITKKALWINLSMVFSIRAYTFSEKPASYNSSCRVTCLFMEFPFGLHTFFFGIVIKQINFRFDAPKDISYFFNIFRTA